MKNMHLDINMKNIKCLEGIVISKKIFVRKHMYMQ